MKRFALAIPLIVGLLLIPSLQLAAQETVDITPQWSRLAQTLEQGKLKGRFVERTPGSYVLVPESRDLPAVRVLNPQKVSPASVRVLLVVSATYDVQKKGIEVQNYQLPTVRLPLSKLKAMNPKVNGNSSPAMSTTKSATKLNPSISTTKSSTKLNPSVSTTKSITKLHPQISEGKIRVERTLTTFRGAVSEALKPGAMSADILSPDDNSTVTRAARKAESDLNRAYQGAVKRGDAGMDDRRAAVRGLAEIRQELKAIYGTYDNYPPWSYDRIYSNAKSVVAIAEPGQTRQALCSGVLIATDLVLTAGHCFRSHHPEDLEVWFGFVETVDQHLPNPVVRKITELVAPPSDKHSEFLTRALEERFDAEMPDYAIVRIETNSQGSTSLEITPQCLRQYHISRGRGLYVIGYPKGTRETVHDNGRVYLPFHLRPLQFEELKRDIEVDFAMLEDEERLRLLEEFVASYVPRGDGADKVFELYDTRWGSQPKLGIVADLFRGNSGSPVFDRDNHCIVGIHTGGTSDTGQRLGASWQTHETVLPIPAVLADLEEQPQTSSLLSAGILTIR